MCSISATTSRVLYLHILAQVYEIVLKITNTQGNKLRWNARRTLEKYVPLMPRTYRKRYYLRFTLGQYNIQKQQGL